MRTRTLGTGRNCGRRYSGRQNEMRCSSSQLSLRGSAGSDLPVPVPVRSTARQFRGARGQAVFVDRVRGSGGGACSDAVGYQSVSMICQFETLKLKMGKATLLHRQHQRQHVQVRVETPVISKASRKKRRRRRVVRHRKRRRKTEIQRNQERRSHSQRRYRSKVRSIMISGRSDLVQPLWI